MGVTDMYFPKIWDVLPFSKICFKRKQPIEKDLINFIVV